MTVKTWKALVAPLGKLTDDRRGLSPDVEYTLPEAGAPVDLRPDGHTPGPVVGRATGLVREGDNLYLTGTLNDGVDRGLLVGLSPQVFTAGLVYPGERVDTPDLIRSVRLDDQPAWPEVWFRVDD